VKTGGSFGGGKCIDCGTATANRRCKACYLKDSAPETPLRKVSRDSGISLRKLARDCDVPGHSFTHYARGFPVGGGLGKRAIRMSKVMGIPLETVLLGTREPEPTPPKDTRQMSMFGEDDGQT